MSTWSPQLNFARVELAEEKFNEGGLIHVETRQQSAFVRVKILETGPYVGYDYTNHGWIQRAHAHTLRKGDSILVTRQDLLVHYGPDGEKIFFVRDVQAVGLEGK